MEAGKPSRFGWNLRTFSLVLFVSGLVTHAGDLRLVRGGLIRGRVIDVADGRPVRLARAMNWADAVMLYGPSRPAGGAVESVLIQPDGSFEIRAAPGLNHLYVNGARNDPRCPREITVEVREGETTKVELPTLWSER